MTLTATYSPEDNKLRLYASSRLDAELYARVKAQGFRWAPKQDLFVAPMWTPQREDFLIELAGEIDDEDTSLVDRAEERAERFEDYSDKRAHDAAAAERAVSAIADNIPFGQPILVGHHSEKHARRDAAKIENGMRRAISCWETSSYWTRRAAGALRHAKYKERPDVRHRRIKNLEAEKRKKERDRDEARARLDAWAAVEALTPETALRLANCPGIYGLWSDLEAGRITPDEARERVERGATATIEWAARWITHCENRIAYERAMLDEAGGIAAEKWTLEVGGQVLTRFGWKIIKRVNKKDGRAQSVTVFGQGWTTGVEEIRDYKAPEPEDAEKVKAVTKLAPIVNFPGEGFEQMTKAEYDARVPTWSDFAKLERVKATDTTGAFRVRVLPLRGSTWNRVRVYLADQKRVDPPALTPEPAAAAENLRAKLPAPEARPTVERQPDEARERAAELKEQLGAGVAVVVAPQLFNTSPELARRLVDLADIRPGCRALEPSAGLGAIAEALRSAGADVVCVEIDPRLYAVLREKGFSDTACCDFLYVGPEIGPFDRIVMNPPFAGGADIAHIQHARGLLRPGGRLVAICANGPRQAKSLKPEADEWIELEGAFAAEGTNVRTAIVVYTNLAAGSHRPEDKPEDAPEATAQPEPWREPVALSLF